MICLFMSPAPYIIHAHICAHMSTNTHTCIYMHTRDLQGQHVPPGLQEPGLCSHKPREVPVRAAGSRHCSRTLSLSLPPARAGAHTARHSPGRRGLETPPSAQCPGPASLTGPAPGKPGTLLGALDTSTLVPSSVRWPCNPRPSTLSPQPGGWRLGSESGGFLGEEQENVPWGPGCVWSPGC